jgi:methionine sulfoxide reductase heme-binding subunit
MAPAASAGRRFGWLKGFVFIASLLPLLRLLGAAIFHWFDGLGANPIEFITRSTGTWTLVFLCATLAVTPVRKITGLSDLARLRRMLGLFTFFYASLHFTTYIWFDQWFDLASVSKDIWKRPFVAAGFAAFVLMIPLAVTSTNAMMKRLGRRWSKLHRLIYLVAPIAIAHYWWHKGGKNSYEEPIIYGLIIALLLGYRMFQKFKVKTSLGHIAKQ